MMFNFFPTRALLFARQCAAGRKLLDVTLVLFFPLFLVLIMSLERIIEYIASQSHVAKQYCAINIIIILL